MVSLIACLDAKIKARTTLPKVVSPVGQVNLKDYPSMFEALRGLGLTKEQALMTMSKNNL